MHIKELKHHKSTLQPRNSRQYQVLINIFHKNITNFTSTGDNVSIKTQIFQK